MSHPDLIATVGRTPLVELGDWPRIYRDGCTQDSRCGNPCDSVKDRVGVALIEDAERRVILEPGMTIIEATGRNTGIGMAFVPARGHRRNDYGSGGGAEGAEARSSHSGRRAIERSRSLRDDRLDLIGFQASDSSTVLNRSIIDEIVMATDDDAFCGIPAGVSAGAALHAAPEVAARPGAKDRTIVVILADTAGR